MTFHHAEPWPTPRISGIELGHGTLEHLGFLFGFYLRNNSWVFFDSLCCWWNHIFYPKKTLSKKVSKDPPQWHSTVTNSRKWGIISSCMQSRINNGHLKPFHKNTRKDPTCFLIQVWALLEMPGTLWKIMKNHPKKGHWPRHPKSSKFVCACLNPQTSCGARLLGVPITYSTGIWRNLDVLG